MEVLNKLSSLFQQALETREPSVDLLESFVDHWKGITNYYIETTDESRPARQTDIPWRLKQMLDILVYEEKQQGVEETGPCLEYLLQHKLLETLCTLGKAQYPPGMSQQVLLFFSRLLAQIDKPLLHLINVYRPVQKLIRLCALPASGTEKEEAQFLLVVCSRIKQDPYVLNYVLEISDKPLPPRMAFTSSQSERDRNQPTNHKTETLSSKQSNLLASPSSRDSSQSNSSSSDLDQSVDSNSGASQSSASVCTSGLIPALVQLSQSQRSRVCLKAYEALVLLAGLHSPGTGECLATCTQLCELLVGRLAQQYSLLSLEAMDPQDIYNWPHTPWSGRFSQQGAPSDGPPLPGTDHVTSFFSWLDFLDYLMKEAPKVLAEKMAQIIHQHWLLPILQPQLLHMSEVSVMFSTAVLCAVVRNIKSPALLDQLVLFLLGKHTHTHPEQHTQPDAHTKPDTHTPPEQHTQPDTHTQPEQHTQPDTDTQSVRDGHSSTDTHSDTDTHEDTHTDTDTHTERDTLSDTHPEVRLDTESHPLRYHLIEHCDHISDEISLVTLRLFEELLRKPHRDIVSNLVLRNLERRSYLSPLPPAGPEERPDAFEDLEEDPFFPDSMYSDGDLLFPEPPPPPPPCGSTRAADVINSFLCLVPLEAKSSHLVQGAGYDTYVHDAHTLYQESRSLTEFWGWPEELAPAPLSGESDFYEGHFLKVLFDRLGRLLEQPYEVSLQVTSLLSRLAVFPHPVLQEYLLNPYINLAPDARTLFSVLIRLIGQLMQRIQQLPDVTQRLVRVRQQLVSLQDDSRVEHGTLLRGVILLEEFCKELAAIAFVKMPQDPC